jgi:ABC-2 type transport system ATP-binding protein
MHSQAIIHVLNLCKVFRVLKRKPGFLGGLRTLFSTNYEEVRAVHDVSFEIAPGELVGYIGPNGAGKSTTIKMLTGILYPSSGDVSVAGLTPHRERARNGKQIGVIFGQRSQLLRDIPPRDSFDLMRRMYAVPPDRYRANLKLFTELLDLDELLDRPVRLLSLGQRMRCELVASLLHDPRVVYLDEPTIGLDVVAKDRIREFIQHLNQQRGVTIMLTTHDIADIEKLCKRVLIIDKGQLIYDGSLSAIKQQYGRRRRVIFATADGATPAGLETELAALGDGIQVAPSDEGKVVVSFDPHSVPVSGLTRTIVNHHVVADLTVEEADLEGIIRHDRLLSGGLSAARRRLPPLRAARADGGVGLPGVGARALAHRHTPLSEHRLVSGKTFSNRHLSTSARVGNRLHSHARPRFSHGGQSEVEPLENARLVVGPALLLQPLESEARLRRRLDRQA